MSSLLDNVRLLITKRVGDTGRLNHIKEAIEDNNQLYNSDRKYLNDLIEKYLFSNNDEKPMDTSKKIVVSNPEPIKNIFCTNCGTQMLESAQFCTNCGKTISKINQSISSKVTCPSQNEKKDEEKLFEEKGELMIKTIKHKPKKQKIFQAYMMPFEVVKMLDDVDRTYYEGIITITKNNISCQGNDFPLLDIISIKKTGTISKAITVKFEKNSENRKISIFIEIKTKENKKVLEILEKSKSLQHSF